MSKEGVEMTFGPSKPSLPSSTPLHSFHTIYYWHFFPSFVAAEYKGRKNMQLEYTNRIYTIRDT